jgi:ribosomal protein S18 acetylase RimI-like enzyme
MPHATNELELTSERTPCDEDVRTVRAGLLAFNVARLGDPQYAPVALILRDRAGAVVGGLLGQRRWGWLYIDTLWVHEAYRGRGAGSRLLEAAEAEAVAAGCRHAVLDTFSFQARPFYERHGYRVYATLDGYPPGHCQFFMRKDLVGSGTPAT